MPHLTKKVMGRIWYSVLEEVEALNVLIKRNHVDNTEFIWHVVGGTEARGTNTFTYLCEHKTKEKQHEWLVVRSVRATV